MDNNRGSQRQQQKQATKERILLAAKKLFVEQGFDQTSTRAIAKEAGVAVGTLFVHYPDKSALLIGALFDDIDQVFGEAIATLPQKGIVRQLSHLVECRLDYYLNNRELGRVAMEHMLFQAEGQSEQREHRSRELVALAKRLMEEAIQAGELQPGLDTAVAAQAFAAFYLSAIVGGLRQPQADKARLIGMFQAAMKQQLKLD